MAAIFNVAAQVAFLETEPMPVYLLCHDITALGVAAVQKNSHHLEHTPYLNVNYLQH